jgi:cytochrome c551/c552
MTKTKIMKQKLKGLIALVLFTSPIALQAQDGKAIFNARCAACHSIGNGRLVGPDLKGVATKYKPEYLAKWIRSSQSIIKSGDAKAKAMFLEYNSIVMPDFLDLKDNDLKAVVDYIKSKSGNNK